MSVPRVPLFCVILYVLRQLRRTMFGPDGLEMCVQALGATPPGKALFVFVLKDDS